MSRGSVKHLLIRNESPFDTTVQVVENNPNGRAFVLNPDLLAGHSWLYQLEREPIANGTEFKLQIIHELRTGRSPAVLTFSNSAPNKKAEYLIKGTINDPQIMFKGFVDKDDLSFVLLDEEEIRAGRQYVMSQRIPDPPASLTEKSRWIQCVVRNMTQFRIVLQDHHTYFDSGRYWEPPSDILPFDQMIFTCCNGDGTFFTGATGGTSFRMILDPVTWYDFAIGWTNPYIGSIKAGIVHSSNPQDGYDHASPEGNAFRSQEVFKGIDKDWKAGGWYLHLSASAGSQIIMYTLTEVRNV
ncbi:hypothetical protein GYMLUDRAFT_248402 [Collybiopsis luxurians FD-317 M1]|uniref:Uncharacterized protein n=1 Tax=Collybiopsis luxurians FD-317 M1 TaxID=944289 RepID=A0A0D0CKX8_9AGAR|nr:hypothetical protein GYMLUDRAFT_248402 [Collybiopsis luxurians FD-317 M1]